MDSSSPANGTTDQRGRERPRATGSLGGIPRCRPLYM
ncbi:MAG: hypothetical protein ACYDAX_04165 [Desulfobacteria bacterium]